MQVMVPVRADGRRRARPAGRRRQRHERRVGGQRVGERHGRRVARAGVGDRDRVGEVRAGVDRIGRVGLGHRQIGRRGRRSSSPCRSRCRRSDRPSSSRRSRVLRDHRAAGDAGSTSTTSVKTRAARRRSVAFVQETVPVAPTAGVVQDQPRRRGERHERRAGGHRVGERHGRRVARAGVGHRDRVGDVAAGVDRIGRVGLGDRQIGRRGHGRRRRVALVAGVALGRRRVDGRGVADSTVPAAADGSTATVSVKTALPTREATGSSRRPCRLRRPPASCTTSRPTAGSDTKVVPAGSVSLQRDAAPRRRGRCW